MSLCEDLMRFSLDGKRVEIAVVGLDEKMAEKINSTSLEMLEEIKAVIDDDRYDDPTCFMKIESIIDTFAARGIDCRRHEDI